MKNSKSVRDGHAKASSSFWALFLQRLERKQFPFRSASMVSTEKMEGGAMKVTHAEERRAELRETIQCILQRNSLSGKGAERLRGKMVFFEGYTCGRVANGAVRSLSRWCNYNTRVVDLDL